MSALRPQEDREGAECVCGGYKCRGFLERVVVTDGWWMLPVWQGCWRVLAGWVIRSVDDAFAANGESINDAQS